MALEGDLICASPPVDAPALPVSQVRSTLVASSFQALRKRGLEASYLEHLPAQHHPLIVSVVPGSWLPIDIALAHYRACDALRLDAETVASMGSDVGTQVSRSTLTTIGKLGAGVGATPWTALAASDRFSARIWSGGGIAVWQIGPKEARLSFRQNALFGVPYFRTAFMATMRALVMLITRVAYTRPEISRAPEKDLRLRLSWA